MSIDMSSAKNLSEEQKILIYKHLDLVIQENKITNLTRISTVKEAEILHIEDSLTALPEMNMAKNGVYGDLGTGGGYPGIPLAVASQRETVLIDSVSKKVKIIEDIVERLCLTEQIHVFNGRIEECARSHPNEFAVLTARALSSIPSLLELAAPLLMVDGVLICYKSQLSEEEFDYAEALQDKLGMYLVSDRSFMLSDKKTSRRILVYQKQYESKIALPRRIGLAQKRPLKA